MSLIDTWFAASVLSFVLSFTAAIWLLFRPLAASDGRLSRSLSGMWVVSLFLFATVMTDSLSAFMIKTQPAASPVGSALSKTASWAQMIGAFKERYGTLVLMFSTFAVLYVVSHKQESVSLLIIRALMAIRRLDPFVHDSQLERCTVRLLEHATTADEREWALEVARVTLRHPGDRTIPKDGGVSSQPPKPTLTPDLSDRN